MKRILTLITIMLVQASYFMAEPTVTKHALIIAIGNYPEISGWGPISSLNDIELIQSALSKQGFNHFIILKDSAADKAKIESAFKQLTSSVKENDVVVVHFSSHGQQIMDDDGDEIDGYDEAIVAYGAPARYDKGYNGENHLRDEDLGELLDGVRAQLGKNGDLMVLIDACHSGTGTRGEAVARGGKAPFAPADYKPKRVDDNELGMFEKSKVQTRGASTDLAPMVVISAARADELNYEYNNYGSLSVAFSKSFENLNSNYSYRTLFSKIVKEMSIIAPKQTPALEGDIDRLLFGGKVVNQEPYYALKNIDGDYVQIEGGVFTGLNEGTTIKLYPAGTIQTKGIEPLASGKISYSTAFKCAASLDKKLDGKAVDYWVFASDRTFGDVRVKIKTKNISDRGLRKEVNEMLEAYPLALVAEDSAVFEIVPRGAELTLIRVQDGTVYKDGLTSENNYESLKDAISKYAQGKFLKELEINNPDYNIELELIPVTVQNRTIVDTLDPAAKTGLGGMLEFQSGDAALLKITNHGSFDVYFNIIDIQPDGQVNAVMPDPRKFENPKDFRIKAGQTFIVPRKIIYFAPPYGTETFKIFASYEPLDFSPILRTKGQGGTRGFKNELENLFETSYTMSRGVSVGQLSAETDACTFAYTFRIINPRN